VLKTNGTQNDGFFIGITEDSLGNLYTVTYCNSDIDYPQALKSTDGGNTWIRIASCSVIHMHNIKLSNLTHIMAIYTWFAEKT
jgi:hypothetical protein